MKVKLQSSDDKIILVDPEVIKQMVTIQDMLDFFVSPRMGNNNNDDDPIPIFKVNGEVLDKLVGWTENHIDYTDMDFQVWSNQFFMDNLENFFTLENGAKYLELTSYTLNLGRGAFL